MTRPVRAATFACGLLLVSLCFGSPRLAGQDAAEEASQPQPASDQTQTSAEQEFYQASAKWKAMMLRLSELQYLFPKSRGRQREAIYREYHETIINQGPDMERAVVVAARKAFVENPNHDPAIADFLYAVVDESRHTKRPDESAEIAALLVDGDYQGEEAAIAAAETAFWADHFDDAERFFELAVERGEAAREQADLYIEEIKLRRAEQKRDDLPRVKMSMSYGEGGPSMDVVIELFEDQAPNTVANFNTLVETGWYDGLIFHRVEDDKTGPIEVSLVQGGCPLGDGSGGPPYRIACECLREDVRNHFRGSVAMARTEQLDSAGSQFYICRTPLPYLNGGYTVFGRVLSGMPIIDAAPIRNPKSPTTMPPLTITSAEVIRKRDHDYDVDRLALPPSMLRPESEMPQAP